MGSLYTGYKSLYLSDSQFFTFNIEVISHRVVERIKYTKSLSLCLVHVG